MSIYSLIKPLLFSLPSETAHNLTLKILKQTHQTPWLWRMVPKSSHARDPKLSTKVAGLQFPNPIGVAAGFDKNAEVYREMGNMGFGFVEIGTVTPQPQAGNPKPRMFRITKDNALINRLGFNNEGVLEISARLNDKPESLIVGGNIGKNKNTPNERASADYLYTYDRLYPKVDYFTLNLSSPNTPGLRELQNKENLKRVLTDVQENNQRQTMPKPLFLKIAPDLTEPQILEILEIINDQAISGIIATNTTVNREHLQTSHQKLQKIGSGGLSGQPLKAPSTNVIKFIRESTGPHLPIIASGGIMTAGDALEKFEAGANLIQLYTGLVYEGPALLKVILDTMSKRTANLQR